MKQNASLELLDQPLPSDFISEMVVVGTKLLNDMPMPGIYDDHFHHDQTRLAFTALRQMELHQVPMDTRHFVEWLREHDMMEDIGGGAFVGDMIKHAQAAPSRFPEYLARLKERRQRRQAIFSAMTILQTAYRDTQSTDQLLEQAALHFQIAAEETGPSVEYQVMSLAELIGTAHETKYYAESILAADEACIIGAPPKSLKTSVATELAISLATATPVFGVHTVAEPIRVGVMSGESGQAASRICFRSVLASKGVTADDVPNLFWTRDVPIVGTREHNAAMLRMLRKFRPQVLIIDPAYRALQGCDAPENLFRQGALLGELDGLCRGEGATMVLVHHTKRMAGREFAPTTLDDLAWSGFREFFRQWILISRRRPYDIGSGIHELRIDTGGSARHSWSGAVTIDEGPFDAPRWYVTVQGLAESHEAECNAKEQAKELARQERLERDYQKLLAAAAAYPDGETISVLRTHAGLSSEPARAALSAAMNAGEIIATKITKNGRQESGYVLKG